MRSKGRVSHGNFNIGDWRPGFLEADDRIEVVLLGTGIGDAIHLLEEPDLVRGPLLKIGDGSAHGSVVWTSINGAPTAFKLLDMAFEWVLSKSYFRFAQKIGAFRGTVQFPFDIASRPWLQQRLVALYEALEPLRGTIIHGRHFTSAAGAVSVAASKGLLNARKHRGP